MEKNVEISMLCQIYGKVLTEKQYELLDDYYNNDLSLSEIAENNNITRQAVRDIIKKGENKLYELEEKISFMKKILNDEKTINEVNENLDKLIILEEKSNLDNQNNSKDADKNKTEKIKIINIIKNKLNKVL